MKLNFCSCLKPNKIANLTLLIEQYIFPLHVALATTMVYDLMADDTLSRTDLFAATFACLNPFYIVLLLSSVGVCLSSHTLGV